MSKDVLHLSTNWTAKEIPIPLLVQMKTYERLTVRAALEGSRELALEALITNPLVGSRDVAEQLVTEVMPA